MNLDANVQIQNSKNNSCAIRPGRRPRGPALRELVDDYRRRAGILPAEQAQVDGGGVDPVGGGPVDGFSPASEIGRASCRRERRERRAGRRDERAETQGDADWDESMSVGY